MNALFHSNVVSANRIIYTPSPFARSSLLHLQEVGALTARQPHSSRRQSLSSFLFFVVVSGRGTLEYEGKVYALTPGDCVFIDCARSYLHRSSDDLWTLKWAHFCGTNMISIFDKYTSRGGQPVFHPSNIDAFAQLLDQLYLTASSDDYIRDMRINELLSCLLTLIMEQSWQPADTSRVSSKKQYLQTVREYLDDHLTERLTLDALASRFYINKYYLTRTFREQFGMPINAYVSQQRVTRAKQLLRYSDMSVEQIAAQCGVSDPNYFSRLFRKVEGISPGEYRRSWQNTSRE